MLQFINDFVNSQGYYYFYSAILQTFAAMCGVIFIGLFFRFQLGPIIDGLVNVRGYNPKLPEGGLFYRFFIKAVDKSQKDFFKKTYQVPFILSCSIMLISIIMLFIKSLLNCWAIFFISIGVIILIIMTLWNLFVFIELCLNYGSIIKTGEENKSKGQNNGICICRNFINMTFKKLLKNISHKK